MAHQGPTSNGGANGKRPKNAAPTRSVILKALEEENIGRACNADIRKWAIGGNWPGWPTCPDAQIKGMIKSDLDRLVKNEYIVKHAPSLVRLVNLVDKVNHFTRVGRV